MWMNALSTTADAVNKLPVPTYLTASTAPVMLDTPVPTYLTASIAPVMLDTPVMDLPDSFYCTCNAGYTGDGFTCTGTFFVDFFMLFRAT